MARRQINVKKIYVSKRWVKTHTFDEFKEQSFASKLSHKEQLKLWVDAGGKVKKTETK